MSIMGSTGKSGSFFFYSSNGKYMIKAIPYREFRSLLKILKNYINHLENNKNSLIIRFYGLYKLVLYKNHKIKKQLILCVMNNLLKSSVKPDLIFDLKGSSYNREKKTKDSKMAPRKDNDWVKADFKLLFTKEKYNRFLKIIEKDKEFLKSQNLIDYSLLVGIWKKDSIDSRNYLFLLYIEQIGENSRSKSYKKSFGDKISHRSGILKHKTENLSSYYINSPYKANDVFNPSTIVILC